ncbi:MAG: hypothetical protein FWH27_10730 [Planctomycetaceae bacterium]|nr:hypothetical protein [Planctomycetaceae bacterium]
MGGKLPQINESVNFLFKYNPDSLARLEEVLPSEMRLYLKPGGALGEDDDPFLEPRLKVSIKALETIIPTCESALSIGKSQIQKARRIKLIAGITTIVGSSAILATLAANSVLMATICGFVTLTGAIFTFASDFIMNSDFVPMKDKFENYLKLPLYIFDAKQILNELLFYCDCDNKLISQNSTRIEELISKTNDLAFKVIKICPMFI